MTALVVALAVLVVGVLGTYAWAVHRIVKPTGRPSVRQARRILTGYYVTRGE